MSFNDDDQPAVIAGNFVKVSTMADGTPRITLDLSCSLMDLARLDLAPGSMVAIARLTQEAAGNHMAARLTQDAAQYGQEAKALKQSGFFRAPAVWALIGSDGDYLEWCKTQPCAKTNLNGVPDNPVVAAHVRRVANGAGTGIKPPYSAIPLLSHLHMVQHQHGESAIANAEWWDRQRVRHLERWGWETLKARLGYKHWNQIEPWKLREWAEDRDVSQYLPREYK